MTGPSALLKAICALDQEGLMRWAWRQGRDGIDLEAARNVGLTRGHNTHRALENLVKGYRPGIVAYAVNERRFVAALYDWWDTTEPRVLHTETAVTVTIEGLKLNGRIDYVRACDRPACACGNNGAVIGDLKTGGLDGPRAQLQVGGAYPLMWQACERSPPFCHAELIGLGIRDEEPWVLRHPVATPEDFLLAVAWYARLIRIAGP